MQWVVFLEIEIVETNPWIIMLCRVAVIMLYSILTVCEGRKNVLFLMADDLRPELRAYYGKDYPSIVHPPMHTPNLDRLASRSLLLERAYVQQALCNPSRTSLLTSRRPDTTRVYDLDHYWRQVGGNFTTLPQFYKEQGYRSVGIGKIFHHGAASGHDDPVSWSEPFSTPHPSFEDITHSWKAVPDHLLKDNPLVDEKIADAAIQKLQTLATGAKHGHNFFLAVGFKKPHLPFVFPESMLQYYSNSSIDLPPNPYAPVNMPDKAWSTYNELRAFGDIASLHQSGAINTTLPDDQVLALRRAYYATVTWMDMQVGRVLDELERLGLGNDTVVSFLGDHGYFLGEHGEWCKHSNFELATHAPLMIRVPGRTDHGIKTKQLAEFVDIFPTIVEASGLSQVQQCPAYSANVKLCSEGTSLMPLIQSPDTAIRNVALSQYPRGKTVMGYSIRTPDFRYTQWIRYNQAYRHQPDWTHVLGEELYDHRHGRSENWNVVNSHAQQATRNNLRQMLHAAFNPHSNGAVLIG